MGHPHLPEFEMPKMLETFGIRYLISESDSRVQGFLAFVILLRKDRGDESGGAHIGHGPLAFAASCRSFIH
jgi:hypothetical protein